MSHEDCFLLDALRMRSVTRSFESEVRGSFIFNQVLVMVDILIRMLMWTVPKIGELMGGPD